MNDAEFSSRDVPNLRAIGASSTTALALRLLGLALGVVVVASLGRGLGKDGLGWFTAALTVCGLAQLLGSFGMPQIASARMAADPTVEGPLLAGVGALRILAAVPLIAAGFFLTASAPSTIRAGCWLVLLSPIAQLPSVLEVGFDARLRPDLTAAASLTQSVMWACGAAVAATLGSPIAFGFAFLLATCAESLAAVVFASRIGLRVAPAGLVASLRPHLRSAVGAGLAQVLWFASVRLPALLGPRLAGSSQQGTFAGATWFSDAAVVAPSLTGSVLTPLIARASTPTLMTQVSAVMTLVTVGGVVIASAFQPLARQLSLLVLGPEFGSAGPTAALLMWWVAAFSFDVAAGSLLLATRNVRPMVSSAGLAALVTVVAFSAMAAVGLTSAAMAAVVLAAGVVRSAALCFATGRAAPAGLSRGWWLPGVGAAAGGLLANLLLSSAPSFAAAVFAAIAAVLAAAISCKRSPSWWASQLMAAKKRIGSSTA